MVPLFKEQIPDVPLDQSIYTKQEKMKSDSKASGLGAEKR